MLSLVRGANAGKKIRMNTYVYGQPDADASKVMNRIARENAGRYNYVCPD